MTQEGGTPPNFWDRVEQIAKKVVNDYVRSGLLNSASISSGGLTLKGGALKVLYATGDLAVYFGRLVSGSSYAGTGLLIQEPNGTDIASFSYNEETGTHTANLHDGQNNLIVGNDSASGQGLARPYVPFVFYRSRSNDWPTVSSTTFETVYRARGPKQHPKLYVETWLHATAAGAVAEIQVLVNGSVWGVPQQSNGAFVTGLNFGPLAVDGSHMSTMAIEVQARIVSGGGTAEVGVGRIEGRQS